MRIISIILILTSYLSNAEDIKFSFNENGIMQVDGLSKNIDSRKKVMPVSRRRILQNKNNPKFISALNKFLGMDYKKVVLKLNEKNNAYLTQEYLLKNLSVAFYGKLMDQLNKVNGSTYSDVSCKQTTENQSSPSQNENDLALSSCVKNYMDSLVKSKGKSKNGLVYKGNGGQHETMSLNAFLKRQNMTRKEVVSQEIKLNDGTKVSPWEINALVDFFETPERMIKNKDMLFLGNIKAVLQMLREEAYITVMQTCGVSGYKFPDRDFQFSTKGKDYMSIAAKNEDHFFPQNLMYYSKYHEQALEYALMYNKTDREISNTGKEVDKITQRISELRMRDNLSSVKLIELKGLIKTLSKIIEREDTLISLRKDLKSKAMLYESWSQHYLVDSFSAGHMRAPRRELSKANSTPVSGKITQAIHNTDGDRGLLVTNALGQNWVLSGDHDHFENSSSLHTNESEKRVSFSDKKGVIEPAKSSIIAEKALSISTDEVLNVMFIGEEKMPQNEFSALYFIPVLHPEQVSITEDFHTKKDSSGKRYAVEEAVNNLTPLVKNLPVPFLSKMHLKNGFRSLPGLLDKQGREGLQILNNTIVNDKKLSIPTTELVNYSMGIPNSYVELLGSNTTYKEVSTRKGQMGRAAKKSYVKDGRINLLRRIPASIVKHIIAPGKSNKTASRDDCRKSKELSKSNKDCIYYEKTGTSLADKEDRNKEKINYFNYYHYR